MNILSIVILCICCIYMLLNFKHDIHMLQQNSYRISRYWRWLRNDMASTWRLMDVAMIFLLMASNLLPYQLAALVIALICVTKVFLIFKKKFKKPLVFTKRVYRIYILTSILSLGAVIPIACITAHKSYPPIYNGFQLTIALILLICIFSWIVVILAVWLLNPVERHINSKYKKEAVNILRSMPELKIIGITGSYGKTSTKHYLQRILSEQFETLMTPGSYNTPMGVVRTIRELMKPYTQIFICEMGAKQKGDIKEICTIVKPEMGIITAVGPMHLETFKSIENVQDTKFELADALPKDGLIIVNNDFAYCANRKVNNVACLRYGIENTSDCDYQAQNIRYSSSGTTFELIDKEGTITEFSTPLIGECNVSNLLAAIILAIKLGVPIQKIKYAVSRIQQVEHRLSMAQTAFGVTIIDDAFNSNPAGAKMAVDVLANFDKKGKKIIITPGMIELGEKQYDLNRAIGKYAGNHVDVAIIVGEYNREALMEGLKASTLPDNNIHVADSFIEAQEILGRILTTGDVVLYENDLPDSFK